VFLQQYRLTRRSGIMDNVALDVIIGLVFIYLLFSILLTSFSELVFNNFLGLRGKNLDVALKSAFGASASRLIGGDSSADGLVKDFFQNGLVSSLFMNGRTPSELPPDLFAKAYLAVLGNFSGPTDRPSTPAEFLNKLRKNTALSNHQKIVGVLDPLLAGSETSWEGFESNVAKWFGDLGERSRGWYKRKMDVRMLGLAFALALLCNVDTLFIVRMLQLDKQHREQLASQAAKYVAEAESKAIAKSDAAKSPQTERAEVQKRFIEKIEAALKRLDGPSTQSAKLRSVYKRCAQPENCDSNPYTWYENLSKISKDVQSVRDGSSVTDIPQTLETARRALFSLSSDIGAARSYRDPSHKEDAEIRHELAALRTDVDAAELILRPKLDIAATPLLATDVMRICRVPTKGDATTGKADPGQALVPASSKRCIELHELAASGKLGFPIGWSPELREFQKLVTGGEWILPDNNSVYWISPLNVLGLLLTTLALILGAPFWFDVLRRLVPMRQVAGKAADNVAAGASAGSTVAGGSAASQPAVGAPPAGSTWFADAVNDTERRLSSDLIRQLQARLEVAQITGRLDQATRDAIYQWRQRRRPGAEPSWELDESMVKELLWTTSDPLLSGQPGLSAVTVLPASDGPMADLKLGSRNAEVTRLRGLLAASGFIDATASGSDEFDEELARAVKVFQTNKGLAYDGSVGPVTWLKLSNDPDRLPAAYAAPQWMARAIHEMGVTEIAGVGKDNRRIVEYQQVTGSTLGDETPWCSSFVNWVIKHCGIKPTGSATASSWRNWGQETAARYGAVIVIIGVGKADPGTGPGAHVGFLVRETGGYYMVLGGNQGGRGGADSVCVTSFPKSKWRCLAMRWSTEEATLAAGPGGAAKAAADAVDDGVDDLDVAPVLPLVETLTEPRLQFGSGNASAVADLQMRLNLAQKLSLEVDGIFGIQTRDALIDFQRSRKLPLSGIADPGTWYFLRGEAADVTPSSTNMQTSRPPLSDDDIDREIERIKGATRREIEWAAVQAVLRVESSGRGFAGGRPLVRLEGHKLWSFAKQLEIDPAAWVEEGAGLLHPQRTNTHNRKGFAEWQRLEKARQLCEKMFTVKQVPSNNKFGVVAGSDLADISASWGMFQIMGFNWQLCRQANLAAFRTMMEASEAAQLSIFFEFLIGRTGALEALATKNWATFAELYNGTKFRENRYDTKLAQAYFEAKQRRKS
jgi:uncharacterized protein (TIGR02594 family)